MNGFGDAVRYLNDPFNWTRPNGILELLVQHMTISTIAVLAALVLAVPVGIALGSATTIAASTATAEMVMCSAVRSRMPLGRTQLNGSLR